MPITKEQADRLKELVTALVAAEVADSWKGGGDPADIPAIEAERELAQIRLGVFVSELQSSA